jgi:hypothetical protein
MGEVMSEMTCTIEYKYGNTKIKNNSKTHKLWVLEIPEKPKLKYREILVIPPLQFILLEPELDLKQLAFRWEQ